MKNFKSFEEFEIVDLSKDDLDRCPRCGENNDVCSCADDYFSTKNIYRVPAGKLYKFTEKPKETPKTL